MGTGITTTTIEEWSVVSGQWSARKTFYTDH
jgi:hypothetical protein